MTVDEKGLEAAEAELSHVLSDVDYVMPADGMARIITAYLSARSAEPVASDDWVLVPRELTHEMRVAVSKAVGAPNFCDQVWEAAIRATSQRHSASTTA